MSKLLITGGTGFVGRNIIEELHKTEPDIKIYNLSRSKSGLPNVVDLSFDFSTLDFQHLNIDFDYIIHTLALSNEKFCSDFALSKKINIDFTNNLLEFALKQKNLKKLIHISSTILYDNNSPSPVSESSSLNINYTNYSFTKGISEFYMNYYFVKHKLPIIIFRLSNIYGLFQKFVDSPFLVPSKIVEALKQGSITVFNVKPRRDWIYAGDAAEAIVKSLKVEYNGVMNLASGRATSVGELVGEIAGQLSVPYKSLDKPTIGPQNLYCDIAKIKKEVGWKPRTAVREGMSKTIEYIKTHME